MRCQQPRLGQGDLTLLDRLCSDIGYGASIFRPQVRDGVQVNVKIARTPACAGPAIRRSQRSPPPRKREMPCATQIQMGVVLPGDADAAEHLNAVLGVGLAAQIPVAAAVAAVIGASC